MQTQKQVILLHYLQNTHLMMEITVLQTRIKFVPHLDGNTHFQGKVNNQFTLTSN